jgi:hypothetical protein
MRGLLKWLTNWRGFVVAQRDRGKSWSARKNLQNL